MMEVAIFRGGGGGGGGLKASLQTSAKRGINSIVRKNS